MITVYMVINKKNNFQVKLIIAFYGLPTNLIPITPHGYRTLDTAGSTYIGAGRRSCWGRPRSCPRPDRTTSPPPHA